jgi:hypothetical protein
MSLFSRNAGPVFPSDLPVIPLLFSEEQHVSGDAAPRLILVYNDAYRFLIGNIF